MILKVIPCDFTNGNATGSVGPEALLRLPSLFGFHSCRSGGATDLASDLSPFELMTAGRGKDSRSLAHYVEVPVSRRLEWSKFLQK